MTTMTNSLGRLTAWEIDHGVAPAALARLREGMRRAEQPHRGGPAMQEPLLLFPGLGAVPWHDPERYDWVAGLEAAAPAIRADFDRAYGVLGRHPEAADLATAGDWKTYYFHNNGKRHDDHLAACPDTARALGAIPGVGEAGMAYFSVMSAGTAVRPHCGFANLRVRCHLGLVVPPDCWIRVGAQTRTWTEGRCIVFDDSFEHAVGNGQAGFRAVLLLDVWHPDLTAVERAALSHLMVHWADELD